MPRPNKTFRRQKVNAGIAFKKGEREKAYKLWGEAAKGVQEHRAKKQNKKQRAAEEAAAKAAAAAPAPAEKAEDSEKTE